MELPKNLLKIMDIKHFQPEEWWITMSVEDDISAQSLLRILRSQLPTLLSERNLHHALKYQLREVIDALLAYTIQSRSEHGEVAVLILASFHEKKMSRARKKDIQNVLSFNSFPLVKVIETKVSLSNIPDVSLAMHHAALDDIERMILTVSAQEARLYKGGMVKDEFCIKITANEFIQPDHNRYYEKMSTTAGQSVRHGTGSEKVVRTFEAGLAFFLKEQIKTAQSAYSFEMLHVFLSQQFAPLIENIGKMISDEIPNAQVSIEIISSNSFTNVHIETNFNTIQPDISAYNKIVGLHDVVKALRMHQVDKVFIPQSLQRQGYVTPEAQCYTYPVKGSKRVASIRPWVYKLAHDSAAQISLLASPTQQPEITAVKRY